MADWKKPYSLDNQDDFQSPWWNPSGPYLYLFFLGLLIAIIWGVRSYFFSTDDAYGVKDVPLITAAPGPFRIISDQYEKPIVPHQEKLLYEKLDPTGALEKVVRTSPGAEMPLDLQESLGLSKEMSWDLSNPDEELTSSEKEEMSQEIDHSKKPKEGREKVRETQQSSQKKESSRQGRPGVSKGKYWIQLLTAGSHKEAMAKWQELKKKHHAVLSRYHPQIVRQNRGKKQAPKYQLSLGYFADMQMADKICQSLQEKGATCIVGRD